jgi:hypothetical protein
MHFGIYKATLPEDEFPTVISQLVVFPFVPLLTVLVMILT